MHTLSACICCSWAARCSTRTPWRASWRASAAGVFRRLARTTQHLYCRGPLFHPTSSSSRATPVLASVCVGRRAVAFSKHAVFERRQHVPFRSVVRLNVRSSSPDATHWHRRAIQVFADTLRLPALGTGPRYGRVLAPAGLELEGLLIMTRYVPGAPCNSESIAGLVGCTLKLRSCDREVLSSVDGRPPTPYTPAMERRGAYSVVRCVACV